MALVNYNNDPVDRDGTIKENRQLIPVKLQ